MSQSASGGRQLTCKPSAGKSVTINEMLTVDGPKLI